MEKIRKQTYTLEAFLNKIRKEDICSDQDVQRMADQWDKNMINELVVTVLINDYIPPIILGEEELGVGVQLWVIDGLQRSSNLLKFRYGNYKVSLNVEEYLIKYQTQIIDNSGKVERDECGNIKWETLEFDIRNKTYDELPIELKNKFNEYQIETVIHQHCNMKIISKLIRRYNNHTAMNAAQKSFTYIDNFAREIRDISINSRFFKDCGTYTENDRSKGKIERIIMESVMCMFHLNNWKKGAKDIGTFLNKHATKEEFEILNQNLNRLENVISNGFKDIFTTKDSFIWFALFERFTHFDLEDKKFKNFVSEFISNLRSKKVGGVSFDDINKNRSTKSKVVIIDKLNLLDLLMHEYFEIEKGSIVYQFNIKNSDISKYLDNFKQSEFIKAMEFTSEVSVVKMGLQYLAISLMHKDMNDSEIEKYVNETVFDEYYLQDALLYLDILNDWSLNVSNSSKIFDKYNIPVLLNIVRLSIKEDIDDWCVKWFIKYTDTFETNEHYKQTQIQLYEESVNDLYNFIKNEIYISK